jgi:hypothetical protein
MLAPLRSCVAVAEVLPVGGFRLGCSLDGGLLGSLNLFALVFCGLLRHHFFSDVAEEISAA